MSSLLVIGPSDPAELGLLRALGAQGFHLHLVPGTLVEPARAAGVDARCALSALDLGARAWVAGERARFTTNLELAEPGLAERFTVRGLPLWARMREPFRATLIEAAERVATTVALVDTLAARDALAGVVLGHDTVPAGRAAVEAARRLGLPSIHVPHAVLPRPRVEMPWQGTRLFADLVCAPGAWSQASYLERGAAPAAVAVTGCPRWDGYAVLDERRRRRQRLAVARALRLDPAAPIVLFGPSWLERATANASQHLPGALAIYRGVLAAVRARDVQLVVKLHPGEVTRPGLRPEALIEGWVGVARRAGVTRIAVTAGHREALVAAADVAVTVNSNLGLEAMLCRRPVINVPLAPEEASVLFTPDDGVLALRAPDDVEEALAAVLGDAALRARLAAAGRELVERYVHAPDGRAGERVAATVARRVRPADRAGGRQEPAAAAGAAACRRHAAGRAAGTGLAPREAGQLADGMGER